MPHVTKIARKPKGVGAELKDAADSETNIIIRLELQEGAEHMAAKKFTDICQSKGTAQALRLTKPWHHSGRTVNGDSAFASVQTAVELKRRVFNPEMLVPRELTSPCTHTNKRSLSILLFAVSLITLMKILIRMT